MGNGNHATIHVMKGGLYKTTIPKAIARALGFKHKTRIAFFIEAGQLVIREEKE